MNRKGRMTIPTDESFVEETKKIADLWGADAVRDCDGTELPKNAHEIAKEVYKTYFVVRGDNQWARKHPEEAHRSFLLSKTVTATENQVEISFMEGYLPDEFDSDYEEVARWQAFDRTTGKEVKFEVIDKKKHIIRIKDAIPYHEYNLDFLSRITWHPVQIYNYLTNHWTVEKQLVYDPSYPCTREYIKDHMRKWCEENPDIDVVRFTTFLYQFSLYFNEKGKEKYVEWFGYGLAGSPRLLDGFEKESGIHMTAEDIVQGGLYNNAFEVPTKKFLSYMDYIQRFVTSVMKELVDIVHSYHKKAMMFLGDDWIGSEPYGKYFKNMGLDAVVGSIGGGVTVRMLSEIPGVQVHEGRFLPYFFPDTFYEGNEQGALNELNHNWMTARRALLRKPLDRMGFGGYLSLAAMFPSFIQRVGEIGDEFRSIVSVAEQGEPYCSLKVAVLNSWGKIRSWMSHMVAHELWYQAIYSYQGILESLSGLPVEVSFLSFEDIRKEGIPEDIDVLINVGDRDTSFSGGENWNDPEILEKVRQFVAQGKGFIGVGEPSAYLKDGHLFALRDVLGVDEEVSLTLSWDKYNIEKKKSFITEDIHSAIDYGEGKKNIYALDGTDVLDIDFSPRFIRNVNVGEVKLAEHDYFKGRGVYIAGLPYSPDNARLLYRAMLYSAHKEDELKKAFLSNPLTEVSYYPTSKKYCLINNSETEQKTEFFDIHGKEKEISLAPHGYLWMDED